MDLKLGIGITTYNRAAHLARTLDAVAAFTETPHLLRVADDGSSDGTADLLRERRVAHLAPPNGGVAWNKNRLLYDLAHVEGCDVVLLLEDDTRPTRAGWERAWIEAARRHGHMNFAGDWILTHVTSGAGTPADPYRSPVTSGQCVVFSRAAIEAAGFMDTRFRRYGYEHGEHTERLVKSGFGGDPATGEVFLIDSDLVVTEGDALLYTDALEEAGRIYLEVKADTSLYRPAWRSAEELDRLGSELRAAAFYDGGSRFHRLWRTWAPVMRWGEARRRATGAIAPAAASR